MLVKIALLATAALHPDRLTSALAVVSHLVLWIGSRQGWVPALNTHVTPFYDRRKGDHRNVA